VKLTGIGTDHGPDHTLLLMSEIVMTEATTNNTIRSLQNRPNINAIEMMNQLLAKIDREIKTGDDVSFS